MYYLNLFTTCCLRPAPNKVRYIFNKNKLQKNIHLNHFNNVYLRNASFNVYLSQLKTYKYLDLNINIIIIYYDNSYKSKVLTKRISNKDSHKYLTLNLNNYLSSSDLSKFKLIFIDFYTTNGLLYIVNQSVAQAPFIHLEFNQGRKAANSFKSPKGTKYNYYDLLNLYASKKADKCLKLPASNNYTLTKQYNCSNQTIKDAIKDISNNHSYYTNAIQDQKPKLLPKAELPSFTELDNNSLDKLIFKYDCDNLYSLLKKLINKFLKVKIEFNGTKVLCGTLDKVTNHTIYLKDNNSIHLVVIDAISIIQCPENFDTKNLSFNDNQSELTSALRCIKDNNVNLNFNDPSMNISSLKIKHYCDSFVQAEEINTHKTYFLNTAHIKTIENIPQIKS